MDESVDSGKNQQSSLNGDPIEDSGYSSNLSEISESFRHQTPVYNCTPVFNPHIHSNAFKAYQNNSFSPSKRIRFDSSTFEDSPYLSSAADFTSAGKRSSVESQEYESISSIEIHSAKKFRTDSDGKTNSVSKNSFKEAPGSAEPKFFVSTPYANFSDYIDRLKLTPSPAVKTTLTGRLHVDFLEHLGVKGVHNPALQKIFSYLSAHELYLASRVSKTWQKLITSDEVSNKRIKKFLYRPMKENVVPSSSRLKSSDDDELLPMAMGRVRLMEIQNRGAQNAQCQNKETLTNKSPPVSPSKVRFHLFQKEARKLDPGEQLVSCPRCSLPSRQDKSNNVGSCTRQGCQYQFCLNCYCEFRQPHSCSLLTPRYSNKNSCIINSKKSRKFLRRL